jgi:hypothetical protein
MSLGKEYLTTVLKRFKYYKELGEKTFEQLEDKDLHYLPTSESNSIAIIVQHLAGNMMEKKNGVNVMTNSKFIIIQSNR